MIERRSRSTAIPAPPPPRTNFLKSLTVTSISGGLALLVKFEPATGFTGWFSIYRNGEYVEAVYAQEAAITQTVIQSVDGNNSISVLWTGTKQNRKQDNVIDSTEATGRKVRLDWTWELEIIGDEDSELDNWTLNGLTLAAVEQGSALTRRQIRVDITESGGTATIVGRANGVTLFSGSATLGNTATLNEVNQSGVYGSVDVGAATVTESETLALRLPASVDVLRGSVPSPTTDIATVEFTGGATGYWREPDNLDGGTYYYRLQATSDTGDVGDYGDDIFIIVPATPEPPTDLAYSSGGAADTVLSFTASPTAGASYNLYMRAIGDDIFDVQTPVATAVAGSTTISAPSISGYPGTVTFLLRAELAGIEEKNGYELDIEYDAAGVYVEPRPNASTINTVDVVDGTSVNVSLLYDSTGEKGTATVGQLFTRTPTGSYNFASPADSDTLTGTGIKSASLSATLANGWHYITTKAATATGLQSETQSDEQLVYVSDQNISSPTPSARLTG